MLKIFTEQERLTDPLQAIVMPKCFLLINAFKCLVFSTKHHVLGKITGKNSLSCACMFCQCFAKMTVTGFSEFGGDNNIFGDNIFLVHSR